MGPVRLRNSAHWGSVNGTQKGKTQGNDSASCLPAGLSVRRSRLGASRRGQRGGTLRIHTPQPPGRRPSNTVFQARWRGHARSTSKPREKGPPRRKRSEKERPTNEASRKQATGRLVTL